MPEPCVEDEELALVEEAGEKIPVKKKVMMGVKQAKVEAKPLQIQMTVAADWTTNTALQSAHTAEMHQPVSLFNEHIEG